MTTTNNDTPARRAWLASVGRQSTNLAARQRLNSVAASVSAKTTKGEELARALTAAKGAYRREQTAALLESREPNLAELERARAAAQRAVDEYAEEFAAARDAADALGAQWKAQQEAEAAEAARLPFLLHAMLQERAAALAPAYTAAAIQFRDAYREMLATTFAADEILRRAGGDPTGEIRTPPLAGSMRASLEIAVPANVPGFDDLPAQLGQPHVADLRREANARAALIVAELQS